MTLVSHNLVIIGDIEYLVSFTINMQVVQWFTITYCENIPLIQRLISFQSHNISDINMVHCADFKISEGKQGGTSLTYQHLILDLRKLKLQRLDIIRSGVEQFGIFVKCFSSYINFN